MIDTAKFPAESSHHDNLLELSSHYSYNPPDDHRHVCDFIDADFLC